MPNENQGLPNLADGLSAPPSLPSGGVGGFGGVVDGDGDGGGRGRHGDGDAGSGKKGGGLFCYGGGNGAPAATHAEMMETLRTLTAKSTARSATPASSSQGSSSSSAPPVAAPLKAASPTDSKRWWLIAIAVGLTLIVLWYALNFG